MTERDLQEALHRAVWEQAAYVLEEQRRWQEREIADAHRLLFARAERERAIERAVILHLSYASDGADVRERIERVLAWEDGARIFATTAVRLVRILGHDHGESIREILDVLERLTGEDGKL